MSDNLTVMTRLQELTVQEIVPTQLPQNMLFLCVFVRVKQIRYDILISEL